MPILSIIIYANSLNSDLYAHYNEISPSFDRQVIKDQALDYIIINQQNQDIVKSENKLPLADIVEVSYFSNGETLNSTIWLLLPITPSQYKINYGFFIDSDNNNLTGVNNGGIDYQYEISWINETKTWNKRILEWASSGEERVIDEIVNLTDFNKGNNYISLSLDLKKILYPKEYRILFYAEYEKNNLLISDFSKWVYVPPPNIEINTNPQNIVLRQGEQKNIELNLNSTFGLEPLVNVSFINRYRDLEIESEYNSIQLPYYGGMSIPVKIKVLKNASLSPHTIFLKTASTFPDIEFIKKNETSGGGDINEFVPINIESQEEEKMLKLVISVERSLSISERIGIMWEQIGGPFAFFYGIIAGLSPWIIKEVKKRINKK
ncbi:MAG TPA: hypothetical protein VLA48_08600 [Nitrososphaeraceae archaeon]|nr:hypothetical protein [Nitrososphaeraceae archaeon]